MIVARPVPVLMAGLLGACLGIALAEAGAGQGTASAAGQGTASAAGEGAGSAAPGKPRAAGPGGQGPASAAGQGPPSAAQGKPRPAARAAPAPGKDFKTFERKPTVLSDEELDRLRGGVLPPGRRGTA